MTQAKIPIKKKRAQRKRGLSLQVYLSKSEIETLKRIARRREVSNSELVRTWIVMHEKRYRGQLRAAAAAQQTKPKRRNALEPAREPADPRQLLIAGAE
jgi:hypothetical protein